MTKVLYRGTIARWLPDDPALISAYHHKLLEKLINNRIVTTNHVVDEKQLSLVILQFKKVIEEDAEIYRDFHEMFDQVILEPQPGQNSITNYMELLAVLNLTITRAPIFDYTSPLITGVPMYAVMAPFCNTEAGYRAFTNTKVNASILKIFDEWSRFLVSPASCNVLVESAGGWFSPEALEVQEQTTGGKFEDVWVSNKDRNHWGFTSWDDFFVRRFKPGVRDVIDPDNSKIINNPCEAVPWQFASDVQATDEFWIKSQPYSLYHILNYDPLASQFVGGSIYQAILSSLAYHRWHSPVKGRVVNSYVIPGAYYAALVDQVNNDPDVVTRSIMAETAMCTRAFIYIEADNPDIGLLCFVGVGLVEISTCKLEVKAGDRVEKGTEIGSFHFGGSTHLLIFRPQTKLQLVPDPEAEARKTARKVNRELFTVENK